MTNFEIITRTAIAEGIFTEAEAMEHIEKRGELPLHTFKGWKARGFQVKKGEKTRIRIGIWQQTKSKTNEETGEEIPGHMFMKTSCFFTGEQVEAIKTA